MNKSVYTYTDFSVQKIQLATAICEMCHSQLHKVYNLAQCHAYHDVREGAQLITQRQEDTNITA